MKTSPGTKAAKTEIANAILRLETVGFRCRHALMGKEWTQRNFDADIIELEVIPALRRAIWVMTPHEPPRIIVIK